MGTSNFITTDYGEHRESDRKVRGAGLSATAKQIERPQVRHILNECRIHRSLNKDAPSIERSNASLPSHHDLFLADSIINIAGSKVLQTGWSFRYTHDTNFLPAHYEFLILINIRHGLAQCSLR
jgi:hypothetical protein